MSEHVDTSPGHKPPRSRRETTRLVVVVLVAVLATIFAVLNLDEVEVNWIITTGSTPLIIVIAASVLAGIAIDRLALHLGRRRKAKPE
jgi:uncharacterized integral membrane protein